MFLILTTEIWQLLTRKIGIDINLHGNEGQLPYTIINIVYSSTSYLQWRHWDAKFLESNMNRQSTFHWEQVICHDCGQTGEVWRIRGYARRWESGGSNRNSRSHCLARDQYERKTRTPTKWCDHTGLVFQTLPAPSHLSSSSSFLGLNPYCSQFCSTHQLVI